MYDFFCISLTSSILYYNLINLNVFYFLGTFQSRHYIHWWNLSIVLILGFMCEQSINQMFYIYRSQSINDKVLIHWVGIYFKFCQSIKCYHSSSGCCIFIFRCQSLQAVYINALCRIIVRILIGWLWNCCPDGFAFNKLYAIPVFSNKTSLNFLYYWLLMMLPTIFPQYFLF